MQSFSRFSAYVRAATYIASLNIVFIAIASILTQAPSSASFARQTQTLNSRWVNTGAPSQFIVNSVIRLNNGEVLGIGANPAGVFEEAAIVRIYNPVTDSWRDTTSLSSPRIEGTAFLLFDGRVLVLGGYKTYPTQIAPGPPEIYDPGTGKWNVVQGDTVEGINPNLFLRSSFTYLPNGKVLLLSQVYLTAHILDPDSGALKQITLPSKINGNSRPSSINLRNGKVLFMNGVIFGQPTPSVEIFDPATESWSLTGSPEFPIAEQSGRLAAILPDGSVLGLFRTTPNQLISYLFDPAAGKWGRTNILRSEFSGIETLPTGEVIAFQENAAEIFNVGSNIWRTVNAPTQRVLNSVLLANGNVFTGKEVYGVDFGATAAPTVTSVSSASFRVGEHARGSLATLFGKDLVGGQGASAVTIKLKDKNGVDHDVNQLFSVSPTQINYLVPEDVPEGQAEITITNTDNGQKQRALISVVSTAPSIFTANANGMGVPAAYADHATQMTCSTALRV